MRLARRILPATALGLAAIVLTGCGASDSGSGSGSGSEVPRTTEKTPDSVTKIGGSTEIKQWSVRLNDGRTVTCLLANGHNWETGMDCDWDHATEPSMAPIGPETAPAIPAPQSSSSPAK